MMVRTDFKKAFISFYSNQDALHLFMSVEVCP